MVRHYDGNGLKRIYVDDIADLAGLIVKVDLDEDYLFTGANETLTLNTHFWVGPYNVGLGSELLPYTFLELLPNNGRLDEWPQRLRSLQVTAKFGWPAIPGAIKDATVLVTREIRDLEQSGMTLALESIDQAVNLAPRAFSIIQRIKREYGRQDGWFA